MAMFESKYTRNKRLFEKKSGMFGVKEGHTIFCDDDCTFTHHDILLAMVTSKRNDQKSFGKFKDCVRRELASGWNRNGNIPDEAEFFRFPLVHWTAVYGKLSALQWIIEEGFDVEVTNTQGETALHRLVECQAHERAVDPRAGRGRRYSLGSIIQVFSKVLNIITGKSPQLLLRYDYVDRNTPSALCLKLLLENIDTSSRLVLYHEAVFKVLCDRLVTLVKQEKLSQEFVRNGFSLKDSKGNTIWHLGASCRSKSVTTSLNQVLRVVERLDLSISNVNYETPILVALKSSNQEFASLLEAYKFSNCTIPIVKMEMLSDSEREECACGHPNSATQPNNATQHGLEHGNTEQETSDDGRNSVSVNSSYDSTSAGQNASIIRDDQSFTEQPRSVSGAIEQERVIFTQPHEISYQDDVSEMCSSRMEVDSTSQHSGDIDSIDGACSQEHIVIEKQIDLCLSVSQSTESPNITTTEENTSHDMQTDELQKPESSLVETDCQNLIAKALKQADVGDNDIFLERFDQQDVNQNIELPTPPDSSTSPDFSEEKVKEPSTPPMKETTACRGVSVTPVLLIKLLSEPDVSEKFQSLLKDVITGDTAKVDSTKSTLQQLKASKLNLDSEVKSSEEFLTAICTRKEKVNEEIQKLQQEICDLQTSEQTTKIKLSQLRDEQEKVSGEIKECELACVRLKRRLSDCTGALVGLSPKSQKRC